MRCLLALPAILCAAAAAAAGHLAVYNWSAYASEEALAAFEAETGLRLIYDTYGESEVAEARLLARGAGYDVAVVSSEYLRRLVAAEAVQPLGMALSEPLDPSVMARLDRIDPGAAHALPYLWGMTGLAVDRAALAARAPDAPADSWALLFDTEWVSRFADCGVALLDAPEEALGAAMLWLGLDPNSEDAGDIAAGLDALEAVAPYVAHFTSEQIDLFAAGEACLALSWNTDVVDVRDVFDFVAPREGALMWIDLFVIPVDAANPDGARRFIETMLRPDLAALNTDETQTATAVLAAAALADPALLADATVYPPLGKKMRLATLDGRDAVAKRAIRRAWTRIKLGGS